MLARLMDNVKVCELGNQKDDLLECPLEVQLVDEKGNGLVLKKDGG
jgi:hypothetical protein